MSVRVAGVIVAIASLVFTSKLLAVQGGYWRNHTCGDVWSGVEGDYEDASGVHHVEVSSGFVFHGGVPYRHDNYTETHCGPSGCTTNSGNNHHDEHEHNNNFHSGWDNDYDHSNQLGQSLRSLCPIDE